jgi:hypothetical protein
MIKSWADCSSDEDTDDNYSVESEEQVEEQTIDAAFSEKVQVDGQGPNEGGPEQQVRTYDFPDRAPFTAFVGNLSYDIQESSQLQQALADVVFERLGERINVLGGRISYDRDSKNRQHRGFGYVELETLEEVRSFLATSIPTINTGMYCILSARIMKTMNRASLNLSVSYFMPVHLLFSSRW